jgi:hypothetical protein
MGKNLLKQIAGTIAQGAVFVGGVVIVTGSLPVPGGHGVRHSVGHGMPHVLKEIEKWKNE